VSLENAQNVNAQNEDIRVYVPTLNVGMLTLTDEVARPLVMAVGFDEPNEIRRDKLHLFLHRAYFACDTSAVQCACALHASFGKCNTFGTLYLANARQTATEALRAVISSNEFRHQETRAGLLELIQEELVGPYLNGGADSFAVMFMQTAGNTLEHQLRSHHEQMCSQRQRREERKRDINERSRIACSSRESSFLLDLAAHLEALDPYWLEFHGEPFEWRGGLKLVRGKDKEWPADAA